MTRPLVIGLLALAAVSAIAPRLPAFGSISGKAVESSLAREVVGDRAPGGCESIGNRTWRCPIALDGGSNNETWWLRLDGRCWVASLSGDFSPPVTRGCVRLRDQVLGF